MLSSVSYVCLGVCAGVWVISRVYVWACSFCLCSRSCCSSVRVIHYEKGGTCRAFGEISRSIYEGQEECLSSVVKRVKEDHSIKWKKVKPVSGSHI